MASVAVDFSRSTLRRAQSPSISIIARQGDISRSIVSEKGSNTSSPPSPRTRLSRKRAASLNANNIDNNDPRIADIALNSAGSVHESTSDSLREQVCLCQPDPKIPRPRNAFILYRQHYQAQVVAQHPGLANPEISKIIGEQWKQQNPEVKNDWRRLAEEEKQRHSRQYPGYRYQPRRAGKSNGIRPVSSSSFDDSIRCPKCHGRYISTPSTPLTPFTTVGSTIRNDRARFAIATSRSIELEPVNRSTNMPHHRMDTPRSAHFYQSFRRPQPSYSPSFPNHTERDEDMDLLSPSSAVKRRRFHDENQRGHVANSPIPYSGPTQFARDAGQISAGPYTQQVPTIGMNTGPQGNMGPPPQPKPSTSHPRHQYSTRSSAYDESLRLPPLQTQMSDSNHSSIAHPNQSKPSDPRLESREAQAKSIEAMVMTIPYINKIKVLTKISPPLPTPTASSPAQEIRGSVIAVESADQELLCQVGDFINDSLTHECAVKSWTSSSLSPSQTSSDMDTEMKDAASAASAKSSSTNIDDYGKDAFVEYLSVIQGWHRKSQEMTRYVTTEPTPSSLPPSSSSRDKLGKSVLSKQAKILPVALVRQGFSLSVSDRYALRIPINDSYAPVDHWQWMATLWRGIAGPDLTIYAVRVGGEEMAKYGGVEVRTDCAAIVVRVIHEDKMDEKTARRLGFEVLECVRNVDGNRFGKT